MSHRGPGVLTIAGSDSSGGAGIQADLKVFAALGVRGTCAVTAVTAQDTTRVYDVLLVPARSVAAQLDAVVGEIPPSAVKVGMLGGRENVEVVSERLRVLKDTPVVLDPVFASTSGTVLLAPDGVALLKDALGGVATLVTPNLAEAEVLTGRKVGSVAEMEAAARQIHRMGVSVLVKGGHLPGDEAVDVFFDGETIEHLSRRRLRGTPHGTGCVLSSAIAAYLALGRTLPEAVRAGVDFTAEVIRS